MSDENMGQDIKGPNVEKIQDIDVQNSTSDVPPPKQTETETETETDTNQDKPEAKKFNPLPGPLGKDKQPANVYLSGMKDPITENGRINIGMDASIEMPEEGQQRAGWYDEKAYLLIEQYPDTYKPPKAVK